MTQNVELSEDDPVPEGFFDTTQEMLSGAVINFEAVLLTPTTVRVPAGPGHAQVSVSIGGKYRFNTAEVQRVHPGGAAGTYDLCVTAADNAPGAGWPAGEDSSFALAIVPEGVAPAGAAIYRVMRKIRWDGAAITRIDRLDLEVPPFLLALADMLLPIGAQLSGPWTQLPAAVAGLPFELQWADGGLIDRTTYARYFAAAGHRYNGGIDPGSNKVRKPDKRGRVSMGAVDFGTGAVTGNARAAAVLGANGGELTHLLSAAESGLVGHGHGVSDPGHSHGVTDPGHGHDVSTFHANPQGPGQVNWGAQWGATVFQSGPPVPVVGFFNLYTSVATGKAYGAGTGISIQGHGTGVGVNGVGSSAAGSGHNNLQPFEADAVMVRVL